MLRKEIEEICSIESFLLQLENHLEICSTKQQFQSCEEEYRKDALFGDESHPQDSIYSLIQENKSKTYEETEEIQRRVNIVQGTPWGKDTVKDMKEQYEIERSEIVDSGLTVWDLKYAYENDILAELGWLEDGLSFSLLRFMEDKTARRTFLWELLDQIFKQIEKESSSVSPSGTMLQIRPSESELTEDMGKTHELMLMVKQMGEVMFMGGGRGLKHKQRGQ